MWAAAPTKTGLFTKNSQIIFAGREEILPGFYLFWVLLDDKLKQNCNKYNTNRYKLWPTGKRTTSACGTRFEILNFS